MITLKIEKLIFGGQGLGRIDGQVVLVWNALPGEEVEVEITKKSKGIWEGIARNIITPSPHRVEPVETHYLSSAPWQIMDFEEENHWKQEIAKETYDKIGGMTGELQLEIVVSKTNQAGYRNKMEFSFAENENQDKTLAFFERGGKKHIPAKGSILATKEINQTAQYILDWVNKQKIPMRSLKVVIVRSNRKGEAIVALFIKDQLNFNDYPELKNGLVGFQLYYSTHKSPAAVPTKLLYSIGQDYLIETINACPAQSADGVGLKYGLLSFFQINPTVFERTLCDIAKFLDPNKTLLDYYSGVGAIGLSLNKHYRDCILVEENGEAVEYAKENIVLNNLSSKCQVELSTSEKMTELISSDKILLVDPPRVGLHLKVVERILSENPERVIYLSCNLTTQARDVALLSGVYGVKFVCLYNYFPQTPHIESLIVLERNTL